MNDYEKLRLENIARNEAFLASIGLSEVKASIINDVLGANNNVIPVKSAFKKSRKRNLNEIEIETDALPTRRSARLSGATSTSEVDGVQSFVTSPSSEAGALKLSRRIPFISTVALDFDDDVKRKPINAKELQAYISHACPKYNEIVTPEAIDHCIHRIRTMNDRALLTRIKNISRGLGMMSLEKMIVFHFALSLVGLDGLAEIAKDVLKAMEEKILGSSVDDEEVDVILENTDVGCNIDNTNDK